MVYICNYESPLGKLVMASDGKSLTGLWFEGQKYFASTVAKEVQCQLMMQRETQTSLYELEDKLPVFEQTRQWLDCYFKGEEPQNMPPLAPAGSEFRKLIWKLLLEIPYGTAVTYGELGRRAAAALGRETMSAQAVGGAVGHNPISILIPCHRVLGAGGTLTGYAAGIEIKEKLLKLEGI